MIVIEILLTLSVLINLLSAIILLIILGGTARVAGDLSSIKDYQSKEHAKVVADEMKKKGYVINKNESEYRNAANGVGTNKSELNTTNRNSSYEKGFILSEKAKELIN